jgi:hypothetical protein
MYDNHQQLLYKPERSIDIPDEYHALAKREDIFIENFPVNNNEQHLGPEIYRCMNRKELYTLIRGNKIHVNDMDMDRLGFSFSISKYYADFIYSTRKPWQLDRKDGYFEYDYIVSFDTNIMFDNFNMVQIEYNIDWFINHPELAWNTLGFEKFSLPEYSGFCHEVLENWESNIDWSTKTELECYTEILKNINNSYFDKFRKDVVYEDITDPNFLLGYKDQHEILLYENTYHFVHGMITNVQSFRKELLNELYNFLTGTKLK